ncbi:MAG: CorA family divalent cation transporter [bacterium]|nr:CorA family divalent cation transporter [bacterium]MDO8581584.1 CorA family divalent cation transporter [bacterium]
MPPAKSIFTHGGVAQSSEKKEVKEAQKAGICVVLKKRDKSFLRHHADTPEECLPVLATAHLSWVDFAVEDVYRDGKVIAKTFGFSNELVGRILSDDKSNYYDFNEEFGMRFPSVRVDKLNVEVIPLAIFVHKGLVLTIHAETSNRLVKFSRYADSFFQKIPKEAGEPEQLTILLARIINENNDRNFDYLRDLEEQGDALSSQLVKNEIEREKVGQDVYRMKHALIRYLDTLWVSLDVISALRHGDPNLLTNDKEILRQFTLMADDINRQIQLSEHMSSVLVSGLEVMQTIYNNQLQVLNNRMTHVMTWLTVLGTAVLVPNTLATVMSSLSDLQPMHHLWYISILVLSTLVSTVGAYWWVKNKARLPAKMKEE